MIATRGAVWVAFGANAMAEVQESTKTFLKHNRVPTMVLTELSADIPRPGGLSTKDKEAHWSKVSVDLWSPYVQTLVLDADTRINGSLSLGFKLLDRGWEVVLVPSFPPHKGACLWHLSESERLHTLKKLGTWRHIMFNSGVVFFRRTKRVQDLFNAWRKEWLLYKDRDQGALVRALQYCPVKMWILGAPFNSLGGAIVNHLFGRAK